MFRFPLFFNFTGAPSLERERVPALPSQHGNSWNTANASSLHHYLLHQTRQIWGVIKFWLMNYFIIYHRIRSKTFKKNCHIVFLKRMKYIILLPNYSVGKRHKFSRSQKKASWLLNTGLLKTLKSILLPIFWYHFVKCNKFYTYLIKIGHHLQYYP